VPRRWPTTLLLSTLALIGAELPDPTRPPGVVPAGPAPTAEPGGMVLRSLLVAPERRLAVIDGTQVREGDRVGGARVLEISLEGVELERAGERLHLRLTAPALRTEAD
jgi:MSHA biogenesis protein MshK